MYSFSQYLSGVTGASSNQQPDLVPHPFFCLFASQSALFVDVTRILISAKRLEPRSRNRTIVDVSGALLSHLLHR